MCMNLRHYFLQNDALESLTVDTDFSGSFPHVVPAEGAKVPNPYHTLHEAGQVSSNF